MDRHGETKGGNAQSLLADANRAVALARAGQLAEGLSLYRRSVTSLRGIGVPVFLHLSMLREAGPVVVDAFRFAALECGGDVSRSYAIRGASAEARLADYRALFADGVTNARMLANYAQLLSMTGRSGELRALMDVERLLKITTVADTAPDGSGRPLHDALRDWFHDNLGRAKRSPAWLAAVDSYRFRDLASYGDPLLDHVRHVLHREVAAYIAGTCASSQDHPMSVWVPKDFTLEMYAYYSDGTGYHLPHIHSHGWITGVYYIECDFGIGAAAEEGGLHLCADAEGDPGCPGWPNRYLPIQPGMLVLMPSYYVHFTRPLGRPSRRLVLPFDIADRRAAGESADKAT